MPCARTDAAGVDRRWRRATGAQRKCGEVPFRIFLQGHFSGASAPAWRPGYARRRQRIRLDAGRISTACDHPLRSVTRGDSAESILRFAAASYLGASICILLWRLHSVLCFPLEAPRRRAHPSVHDLNASRLAKISRDPPRFVSWQPARLLCSSHLSRLSPLIALLPSVNDIASPPPPPSPALRNASARPWAISTTSSRSCRRRRS